MTLLPTKKDAPDIGECIYCGNQDVPLGREHAIPYGLNGPWTLLNASCGDCADVTHRLERDVLRNLFPHVRTVLSLQTRRPRERLRSLPLVIERQGVQEVRQVPPSDFPVYLPMPTYPPPGFVAGRSPDDWSFGPLRLVHLAGPTFDQIVERYPGADFIGARIRFSPDAFARTLAKIALCAAVREVGVQPLRGSPLRPVILGEDLHVGHWVGSWTGEVRNHDCGLHGMQVLSSGTKTRHA